MHQSRHEAGGYRRIELITGDARRRRWTAEEKAAMVAESLQPGSNVSALARRFGVNRGLLQTWRRTAAQAASDHDGLFVPLRLEDASATAASEEPVSRSAASAGSDPASKPGAIEIESAGLRVRFSGPIDPGALRLVLAHIGRRT